LVDDRYPVKITHKGESGDGTLDTRLTQVSFAALIEIMDTMVKFDQLNRAETVYKVKASIDVDEDWADTITHRATLRAPDIAVICEWVAARAAVEDEREAEAEGRQP
jgi:hypothetical protein